MSTGDPERDGRPRTRDEHLRTPDFFNSAEFPTMTFKSTAVRFKGDDPEVVEGNLTLLGVTKPVALRVERWKCGPDPRTQGKRYQCGGNATGAFKRSEFGMKYGLPTASATRSSCGCASTASGSAPSPCGRPRSSSRDQR